MERFKVRTDQRNQFVEITREVQDCAGRSGIVRGICIVYSLHTTAGITINENADPDVVHDMLLFLNKTIPQHQPGFRHAEGNSDSHLKTSFVGTSATVIIEDGQLQLGRWQGIYLCEFDGPRTREVLVQTVGDYD